MKRPLSFIILGSMLAASSCITNESNESLTEDGESIASVKQAITCSGNGCDNRDPAATGCNADATTVDTKNLYDSNNALVGTVELRWSETCKTNWARATRMDGNTSRWTYALIERRYGGNDALFVEHRYVGLVWTNMLYAPISGSARATGIFNVRVPPRHTGVTGWY